MTDAEKRMEMEALLRDIIAPGASPAIWKERARAILAPPPDPDALAKEVLSVGNVAVKAMDSYILLWHELSGAGMAKYRAIAAWVEARDWATWNAALEAAEKIANTHQYPGDAVRGIHRLRKPTPAPKP